MEDIPTWCKQIVCIKLVHLPYLYIWCTVTLTSNCCWYYL